MKKLLLGLLVCLAAVNVFAQTETEEKTEKKADPYLIESILKDQFKSDYGKSRVYELSENLTNEQKMYLYDKYEKSGVGPFFLNLFLGFGIGSFVQGNIGPAVTQLILNLSGTTLNIIGWSLMLTSTNEETKYRSYTSRYTTHFYPYTETSVNSGKLGAGYACIVAGSGLNLGSAISSYITPWTYAADYNKNLKRALRLYDSPWMSATPQLTPIIDPINNNYGLIAKINL